jgi:cysteine synthase A
LEERRVEPDSQLLESFRNEVLGTVPHVEETESGRRVVNPTPLLDITQDVKECARAVYGIDLSGVDFSVFGKLESRIRGGSVKTRPAVEIIMDAISSGRLRRGQLIFEATSGNFGIALGELACLGFRVIALVSRRLQEGVFEELRRENVAAVDLDVDICPAPGSLADSDALAAKAAATNLRSQLLAAGLDAGPFDSARGEIEGLLARQDVIGLAKLLARAYGGFCPEQYDNELNVRAHEWVTGPEIDGQLAEIGLSLSDARVVCAFGTGGTSLGLSRYLAKRYGRKAVHVVFPLSGQDVAGVRTRERASGLRFYTPEAYAGQHEVDFEQARRALRFFVERGHDIGESSALVIYAVIQMLNFGLGGRYVLILADGASKYLKPGKIAVETRHEVSLQEAVSAAGRYGSVVWTHTAFVPNEEGLNLIAEALGCERWKVKVAQPAEVERLVARGDVPDGLKSLLGDGSGDVLLVCLAGGTSLRAAKLLSERGLRAQSLTGGISAITQARGRPIQMFVVPASR